MPALSDDELVNLCLKGSETHAKFLYERYRTYIARVIRNRIHHAEAVEELLQQTFIKIFNGLQSFRKKSSLKTWITGIAVNTVKNHVTRNAQEASLATISLDADTGTDAGGNGKVFKLKDESFNPQAYLLNKEILAIIESALETLSDKHKEVLLCWSEGLSYREIAELKKIPVQTVGSRLHYARSHLQKILAPYVNDTPDTRVHTGEIDGRDMSFL